MLSAVTNEFYQRALLSTEGYILKAQMRITEPWLWNRREFINLNPPIINVFHFCCLLLFFVLLCCNDFRTETAFVVISCQGWLEPYISFNGQEAVWFFCSTVIRAPPHSPFPENTMQSISKYCLPWLKMAHYLWLVFLWFKPPQRNINNPERRRNCPCHQKQDLPLSNFMAYPLENWKLNFISQFQQNITFLT